MTIPAVMSRTEATSPRICAEVGLELDQKMAALLDHLGLRVPDALLAD
jgi:hypothetical protein